MDERYGDKVGPVRAKCVSFIVLGTMDAEICFAGEFKDYFPLVDHWL